MEIKDLNKDQLNTLKMRLYYSSKEELQEMELSEQSINQIERSDIWTDINEEIVEEDF